MLTKSSFLTQPENNAADGQISITIVITNNNSGVGSGVAPWARAPPCWIFLESFISGRLVSQEESSVRGAADLAPRSHREE